MRGCHERGTLSLQTLPPQGLRSAGDLPLICLAIGGDTGFRGSDASCPHSVPRACSEPCNPRPRDHEGRFLPEPLQTNGRAVRVYMLPALPDHLKAWGLSWNVLHPRPQPIPISDPSTIGHLPRGSVPGIIFILLVLTSFSTDSR